MIIRKLFRFEGAHIVRGCTSVRCKENIHGHSYIVEVFITSDRLDDGCMVMDFARLDKIKTLIDSFDHSYSLWKNEISEVKDFINKFNSRVVEIPLSPSAEGYALMFLYLSDKIIKNTTPVNGENNVRVSSVRVHETATGYAEAFRDDLKFVDFSVSDFHFSASIIEDWGDSAWWNNL